jgi:glycerol-3-phosphate acyltransferase PlsY
MGSLLSVFFFEKILAIVSICFVIVGDASAAVVGIAWGRKRLFQKSLEGSFACFVSCSLIGGILLTSSFDCPLNITLAITGALSATLAEHFSNGIINDNLTVPLISGFTMTIVAALQ